MELLDASCYFRLSMLLSALVCDAGLRCSIHALSSFVMCVADCSVELVVFCSWFLDGVLSCMNVKEFSGPAKKEWQVCKHVERELI
jgi:hypothetical protein